MEGLMPRCHGGQKAAAESITDDKDSAVERQLRQRSVIHDSAYL